MIETSQLITLAVCCGYVSNLIGRRTTNIPEIILGVHGFMGFTVTVLKFCITLTPVERHELWVKKSLAPALVKMVDGLQFALLVSNYKTIGRLRSLLNFEYSSLREAQVPIHFLSPSVS